MVSGPAGGLPTPNSSELNKLPRSWGVTLRRDEILVDAESALMVGGANGAPVRHLGILGFGAGYLSDEDIVTSPLENINMSTSGIFDVDEVDGIFAMPLISSSVYASSLPSIQFQFLSDPAELQKGFSPTGQQYTAAVRLSGTAKSAFPKGLEGVDKGVVPMTTELQVVLVADTDLLADRLWVQVQNFFGQQLATAFADNGSFVANLVDNLSGSSSPKPSTWRALKACRPDLRKLKVSWNN